MIAKVENGDLINWKPFVASTVWFSGCNTLCSYCHNTELLLPRYEAPVERFLDMIPSSIKHVVLSGGEPTCSVQFVETLKKLFHAGKSIRLYTNGLNTDFTYIGSLNSVIVSAPEIVFESEILFNMWCGNVHRTIANVGDTVIRIPKNGIDATRIEITFPNTTIEFFEVKG